MSGKGNCGKHVFGAGVTFQPSTAVTFVAAGVEMNKQDMYRKMESFCDTSIACGQKHRSSSQPQVYKHTSLS